MRTESKRGVLEGMTSVLGRELAWEPRGDRTYDVRGGQVLLGGRCAGGVGREAGEDGEESLSTAEARPHPVCK